MGPIGIPELTIVLVIVVIIFGVGRLPEVGSSLGKSIKQFKAETSDPPATDTMKTMDALPESRESSGHEATPRPERQNMRAEDI